MSESLRVAERARIVLLGLRATGKSTVGELLARHFQLEFLDSDQELTRLTGKTPGQWIRQHGQPEFRQRERQVVADVSTREGVVVALGAGALGEAATRERFRAWSVYGLDAPDAVLVRRMRDSAVDRPSLTSRSLEEEVQQLRKERFPLYEELGPVWVDNAGDDPAVAAAWIQRHWLQASATLGPEGRTQR